MFCVNPLSQIFFSLINFMSNEQFTTCLRDLDRQAPNFRVRFIVHSKFIILRFDIQYFLNIEYRISNFEYRSFLLHHNLALPLHLSMTKNSCHIHASGPGAHIQQRGALARPDFFDVHLVAKHIENF